MPWIMMMGGFIYLLYDSITYKLYVNDVNRIEQETGKVAKDLNEEELLKAMKRLRIKKLEITPEDREVISRSNQPAKELSREEIVAAMKRLGITKLEVETKDQQTRTKSQTFRKNRFCVYCGNSLPPDGLYCSKCGKKR
jgi:septum formation inhibitor-activating ATPase MinD